MSSHTSNHLSTMWHGSLGSIGQNRLGLVWTSHQRILRNSPFCLNSRFHLGTISWRMIVLLIRPSPGFRGQIRPYTP